MLRIPHTGDMAKKPKHGYGIITREMQSKGGSVRGVAKGYATLTPEERRQRAVEGAKARWAKKNSEKKLDSSDSVTAY